jgi:LPXTG-motif cell wall-anchored protein
MAASDGAALLVAGTPLPSGAPSQTPGGQPSNGVDTVSVDLGDSTEGAADGVAADLAKVDTTATVTDGAPAATSGAAESLITVNGLGGEVLTPLLGPLDDLLTDTLTAASAPVEATVCGLLPAQLCDAGAIIDVDDAVDELIGDIDALDDEAFTVAQVAVGASVSQASADATDGVIAEAGSTATRIDLFPGLAASLQAITGLIPNAPAQEPLLSVELGNATAKVVRDPVTGAAAPDASAAQLLDINLHDSLGILDEVLGEQVPALVDSLAEAGAALSCDGGALAEVICIDLGAVNELDADELKARGYDFGAGTVGREASAAHLEVLSVLGDVVGGESVLSLDLAQASAAANAVPAAPPAPPAEEQPPLPRTGGDVNTLVALGLFAAAAAGLAAVRRTRHV